MSYKEWKTTYQSKASDEQLQRLEDTKAGHAKHSPPPPVPSPAPTPAPTASPSPPLSTPAAPAGGMSDVCCVPAEELLGTGGEAAACQLPGLRALPTVVPPSAPVAISLGVLTVSDRASQGTYADLSGPEIVSSMEAFAASPAGARWQLSVARKAVVPDEAEHIAAALKAWTARGASAAATGTGTGGGGSGAGGGSAPCNLILTTGGTGMSPRDVTPEATAALLDKPCPAITELLLRGAVQIEPLAALSRACAGVRGRTLIVNLPGRPKAVRENLGILLPLLGHALLELA